MDASSRTPGDGAPIVVFDGVCGFCTKAVRTILENDSAGAIRFAPLQSPLGGRLMREQGLDPADAETFLFIKDGRALVRSDAAVEVARHLRFPWSALAVLGILPRAVRDPIYRLVAKNRYAWFGRRASCFLPSPEERSRFLDLAE
ncbi:MAG TPA: thiol-disulfide oxidoreductase DCC family protein [Acidobacteriota bacterium]|nr:thiol-disulfide oxidoreductase DCC family protein [Acidobacteriota bacterium]